MKLRNLFLPLLVSGMTGTGIAGGISITTGLNSPTMHTGGGPAFLQVCLQVPRTERVERRPMNLSVVLDRSGSMSEQGKLEYAKQAICSLIDQLQEEDIFSLVIYDDVIDVVRPAGHVSDKRTLKDLVREIHPRNSTNLGGGMIEGFRQVERNLRREYVNRVVLLSDGLANVGITNPNELAGIARRNRNNGISLTSMGVGLDYNENLMVALSESGGGNYYFIESPHGIASIMHREFDLMSSVYAHRATIEIRCRDGVRVKDVIGHEWHVNDGTCTVMLGDLYGGETRDITVELQVPAGSGSCELLGGTVKRDADKGQSTEMASFAAKVQYSSDIAVVERNRDMNMQSKADVAISTRAVEQATKAMDEGRMEDAKGIIGAARTALEASPAAPSQDASGAMVKDQANKLGQYQSMLSSGGDARKAKKEIQYENYKTQKQK
jgi:Ca-activated chloride channel family protein